MEHLFSNPRDKHLKIGRIGEDLAVSFLKKEKYRIMDRNYWKPYGEIDIVAQKGGITHFVEVKTVSGVNHETYDSYGPEDNMHLWKRQRLARVIRAYLNEKGEGEDSDWQSDLISVYVNRETGDLAKIEYLEDILLD